MALLRYYGYIGTATFGASKGAHGFRFHDKTGPAVHHVGTLGALQSKPGLLGSALRVGPGSPPVEGVPKSSISKQDGRWGI